MTTGDLQQMFEKYDRNKTGAIEVEELRVLLGDLGLLANKGLAEADSFVVQQFVAADADKDSKLNYEEFTSYYHKVTAPKLSEVLAAEMPDKVAQLRQVFLAFANFGSRQTVEEMDGAKFIKLCKDVRLVGPGLTPTDVDLIFARAKARTARRITFDQFIHALELCGEKKGVEVGEVIDVILQSDGPIVNNATVAEYNKFHDDKTLYTGVYARGGPVTVEIPDGLATIVSRSGCSGGRKSPAAAGCLAAAGAGSPAASTPGMLTPSGSYAATGRRARFTEGSEASNEDLRDVFRAFATFGQGGCGTPGASPAAACAASGGTPPAPKVEMDSVRFVKLCRESGLLGGKLTTTGVDLCFTKVKTKGVRKISFKQFLEAVKLLAKEKGATVEEVRNTLASCEGPMLNGVTQAEYVKFHDDRSTYTGVQARRLSDVGAASPQLEATA